jgi:hypothetical protein
MQDHQLARIGSANSLRTHSHTVDYFLGASSRDRRTEALLDPPEHGNRLPSEPFETFASVIVFEMTRRTIQ